jgi:multicomponent Na+:H+ antiporter subunit F
MEWVDYIVFSLVGLGLIFTVIRLLLGPNLSDRIVSLDTFNMIVIGLIALLALLMNSSLYLDIAIIYAVLAFLETIVFARYLEGKES